MTTKVAVVGATGKMGELACRIIEASAEFELYARLGSSNSLSDMLGADVAVDFTVPDVSPGVVDYAISQGINVLVGTSGWSAERIAAVEKRLRSAPEVGVIIVPNFSVGSMLVTAFSAIAARFYDSIEIVETHHAAKTDSPSGTAVRTAELIGRQAVSPLAPPHADQAARGQMVAGVPIHSIRMSGVVARQDVVFGGIGEVVTLTHHTTSAESYEAGIRLALSAVRAARGVEVGLDKLIDLNLGQSEAAE